MAAPSLIPKPEEQKKDTPPVPELHRTHTFQDDMAQAMDATDAVVVQQMLEEAREKEKTVVEQIRRKKQRRTYIIFSCILTVLAMGAAAYGYYQYQKLTVPLDRTISVGVFPQTEPIEINTIDIRQVVKNIATDTTLPENKPTLVSLITDPASLVPLTNEQFFRFIEANPSEPFQHVISSIRLGAMNTGDAVTPFIIMSVTDPEVASKEFLFTEEQMVHLFYTSLGINIAQFAPEAGRGFESKYLYNLPVRTLSIKDPNTGEDDLVLLYGYAADNIIVITTKPVILKEVYDTIVHQR